ncbi:hypothetical protein [Aeromicrobium sp. 179-A 4D2 NHS]|uniref:hypothetical protein n=1 Tax=Aeromicrobium sp. 179-A 4D2 NHS TaxID=3142375 RepID=UPI0039A0F31E
MSHHTTADLTARISGLAVRKGALQDQKQSIHDSIKPALDAVNDQIDATDTAIAETLVEAMKTDGVALLSNPQTAAEIYRLVYNNGWGMEGFDEPFRELIRPFQTWAFQFAHENNVPVILINVTGAFGRATREEVAESADRIGPIFRAQHAILAEHGKDARLMAGHHPTADSHLYIVFNPNKGGSYRLVSKSDGMFRGDQHTVLTSESLAEVLVHVYDLHAEAARLADALRDDYGYTESFADYD